MLGTTVFKFNRQGGWSWPAGGPNLFQINGQGQYDILCRHFGFHMNIVLTFTNIACCTYIVAICRNLNEILLKLTTQLHSHVIKIHKYWRVVLLSWISSINNSIKTSTYTLPSILKMYAQFRSKSLHRKWRNIYRTINGCGRGTVSKKQA